MIDSHAHLDDEQFEGDRAEVLRRARDAGVGIVVAPGISLASSRRVLELAHEHEGVLAAVGIDRTHAGAATSDALLEIERLAGDDRCVAIGEIGLDRRDDRVPWEMQRRAFEAQAALAARCRLPVIVHCRDAFDECLAVLKGAGLRGVMHCFSGDAGIARRCADLGLMVSFSGIVTFKTAGPLRTAAKALPTEHLLIETDSPYLASEPMRGRRNEPAFLVHTAQFLADLLGLSLADVDRITSTNARILFGLPLDEKPAIVYPIRRSLYVNLTNRCTNSCIFCPRSTNPRVKGHWLGTRVEDEPVAADVIRAIGDPTAWDEIVFCGFGEPTLRLDVMLEVASEVKARSGRTRLNTNGQGDLIAGRSIAPLLKGRIDSISVSLNTADPEQYMAVCRPERGARAFPAVLAFIRSAQENGIAVGITTLDYQGIDVDAVRRVAAELGVEFRLRAYKHLG